MLAKHLFFEVKNFKAGYASFIGLYDTIYIGLISQTIDIKFPALSLIPLQD